MTVARYRNFPPAMGRQVMSPTQARLGADAVKLRRSRSGTAWAAGSGMVVRCRRFSFRPWAACWRMSRSTRLRSTTTPPARSPAAIRLAPYVFPDSAWTSRIRRVSAASAACSAARAGAVFSHR
jgi:hypothetical protein